MSVIVDMGGMAAITSVVTGQAGKVARFNNNDQALQEAIAIGTRITLSAEGPATIVLTEEQSRAYLILIDGSATGIITIETNTNVRKSWVVLDSTTGGFTHVIRPTGEVGVSIPPRQAITVRSNTTNINLTHGYTDGGESGAALTLGTNYAASAREVTRVRKYGASVGSAGGQAILQGSLTKSVAVPANGDVVLTVPANHRPAGPIGFLGVADPATNGAATPIAFELLANGNLVLRNVLAWTPATGVPLDFTITYRVTQ